MKFYNREKEIEILENLKGDFRIGVMGRPIKYFELVNRELIL